MSSSSIVHAPTTGADASTNTTVSVNGELVEFSGTTGKLLKRATGTGMLKLTNGVASIAVDGVDYISTSGGSSKE